MFARLITYENVDLALADQVRDWMADIDEDPFRELPGYRGSITLVDRDNARLVGIGFYASAGQAHEADTLLTTMPDTLAALCQGAPLDVSAFARMRSAGIDVDLWCRAKCIETVFGPMAEAKLLGRSFDEVWNEESSEADRRDMLRNCKLCGMIPKQVDSAYAETIGTAKEYMGRPEVWRAILALADKLKPGRMKGRVAAGIITRALTPSESHIAMPAPGLAECPLHHSTM